MSVLKKSKKTHARRIRDLEIQVSSLTRRVRELDNRVSLLLDWRKEVRLEQSRNDPVTGW